MSATAGKKTGATFPPRSPVEVMDSDLYPIATVELDPVDENEALLRSLIQGGRGRALQVQLSGRYPDCSGDEIEEAIQYACKSFLDEADGISGVLL